VLLRSGVREVLFRKAGTAPVPAHVEATGSGRVFD
jgi:hypothetical protein